MYCECLAKPPGEFAGPNDDPGASLSIAIIEVEARECFPTMSFKGDYNVIANIDNKDRPGLCTWDLWRAKLFNDEGQFVAEGEALATRSLALDSLENILRRIAKPCRHPTPVRLSSVSDHEGIRCSACTDLRECMGSAKAWQEEMDRKQESDRKEK